jgi:HEAT repeat protein
MTAIEEALALLESGDWRKRVEGVRLVARLDDQRAVEALERTLYDTRNTAVIEAAATALMQRFDSESMAALTRAIRSADFETSQTVADVLLGVAERGRFAAGLLAEAPDEGL